MFLNYYGNCRILTISSINPRSVLRNTKEQRINTTQTRLRNRSTLPKSLNAQTNPPKPETLNPLEKPEHTNEPNKTQA